MIRIFIFIGGSLLFLTALINIIAVTNIHVYSDNAKIVGLGAVSGLHHYKMTFDNNCTLRHTDIFSRRLIIESCYRCHGQSVPFNASLFDGYNQEYRKFTNRSKIILDLPPNDYLQVFTVKPRHELLVKMFPSVKNGMEIFFNKLRADFSVFLVVLMFIEYSALFVYLIVYHIRQRLTLRINA